MGNKINNKDKYNSQQTVKSSDFLIGSDGDTLVTKTFNAGALAALLSSVTGYEFDLTNATGIKDGNLVDANGVFGMVQGQSFAVGNLNNSAGFVKEFDSDTGSVVIGDAFTPFTGKVTLFIW